MKVTKKDSTRFFNEMKTFILVNLKGIETTRMASESFGMHTYDIDTIVGKMQITLEEIQGYVYTIFCRFENVDEAKYKFNCNPYTGKYNLHFSPIPIEQAIEVAKNHLETTKGN